MKKSKKGFTLIELLVVIAIIGLLATLSVVALNSARVKSRDARRLSDVKQIQTGLELYFNAKDAYPVEASAVALGTGTKAFLLESGFASSAGANQLLAIPSYPQPADLCAATNQYYYQSDGKTYTLKYCKGSTGATPYTATENSIGQ